MANPYPAVFRDDNSDTRLAGAIDFTDPANQPAGTSVVLAATATLTNAQVLALPTTPVEIIAAPGANKLIVPVHAAVRMTWVADYTNIDATCVVTITTNGTALVTPISNLVVSAVSGLLAGGGPDGTWALTSAGALTDAPASTATRLWALSSFYDSDIANQAVDIRATNGTASNFTGGNAGNALTVTMVYYVVSF